jgi:Txe/YoeB family toxin of Txe-Axe toxin-antitoxin module
MHLSHKHHIVFAYDKNTITLLRTYTHYGDH